MESFSQALNHLMETGRFIYVPSAQEHEAPHENQEGVKTGEFLWRNSVSFSLNQLVLRDSEFVSRTRLCHSLHPHSAVISVPGQPLCPLRATHALLKTAETKRLLVRGFAEFFSRRAERWSD